MDTMQNLRHLATAAKSLKLEKPSLSADLFRKSGISAT